MKRTIIINESQLSVLERLIKEECEPLLNNGSTIEYGNPSQIGTSATVHDTNGNPKPGKDVYADEISGEEAEQGYFGSPRSIR